MGRKTGALRQPEKPTDFSALEKELKEKSERKRNGYNHNYNNDRPRRNRGTAN